MGHLSDLMIEMGNEKMEKWVRDRLDDADEDSIEYRQLVHEYSNYEESLYEEAEWKAELEWLRKNGSSNIHQMFINELDGLKAMMEDHLVTQHQKIFQFHTNMSVRMFYAYSVTLLESFLADTLKSIISEDDDFLRNSIRKFKILKNVKLLELTDTNLDIRSLVFKYLNEFSFHNIPNVKEMYEQVLNVNLSDLDVSDVIKICKLRHDIVHRNGRDFDGKEIEIIPEDFYIAIEGIRKFSNELQKSINKSSFIK
tara:strand:+ start:1635 stop:2396 length:762 start_codon:yes stop_codon:yes gene_type:complete